MRNRIGTAVFGFLLTLKLSGLAATLHVDLNSPNPTAPYSDWTTAATNIQAAIDAAVAGDLVLVTDGTYATGGKVMAGDLTNRIAIDKAITVQSVNGWTRTVIQGEKDAATNGPAAVRCVWLTNGATLAGFTLRNGATRSAGDQFSLRSGGGIWASSTNALVSNCLLVANAAHYGGGAYRGWFDNCTIKANAAQSDGGGGYGNVVNRCLVTENIAGGNGGGMYGGRSYNSAINANAAFNGGGSYGGVFVNSTITFNRAGNSSGGFSFVPGATVTNSVLWANTALSSANYSGSGFRNTCSSPLPPGTGNISADPLLLADGIHISSNSPCRAVGSSIAAGTDLDGQAWNNPPAMGCDEWKPEPGLTPAKLHFDAWGKARVSATAIGQPPFVYRWVKGGDLLTDGGSWSGTDTENLTISPINPTDAGSYQLIASNSLGVVTSQVAQLTIRFVNANGVAAAPPYADWTSAATNIQDAVDVAESDDLVLVASGIYGRGGKVMATDLTNRVVLDKPVTLMSVNGPSATVIQGVWDLATTNGPGAVRGVWMADGAALVGFAVRGGATRGLVGDVANLQAGGGVWCGSTNAQIGNCIIYGNAAGSGGGGGVFRGTLHNSLVTGNTASGNGAGVAFSSLVNCTVVENFVRNQITAGIYGQSTNRVYNSIVWGNYRPGSSTPLLEYSGVFFTNSCTRPLPAGAGNISADPLLASDGVHLSASSPCLNAGSSNFAAGYDLDGQAWSGQPSMGCDERLLQLAVGQPAIIPTGDGRIRLRVSPVGAAAENYWWFKDGVLLANDARIYGAQSAELAISSFVPADAGFYHAVMANSLGSVTSAVAQVRPHFVNASNLAPTPPYSTWGTAAATIQDAIDHANYGDLIVVADGTYVSGGSVTSGDLTNRVALSKAVAVTSLSGPTNSIIEGQKDSGGPRGNGNTAIRAVWLENWTSLAGFTIRSGATRTNGDVGTLQSGGGIWGLNSSGVIRGCLVTNNGAQQNGGGALRIQLEDCAVLRNAATNGGGVYQGVLDRCFVIGNQALNQSNFEGGGGAYASTLRNSLIHQNTAKAGGGTIGSTLFSCTVTENSGRGIGFGDFAYNSIIWGNTPGDYGISLSFHYTCAKSDPALVGVGGTNNLFVDPQLVDAFHLSVNSPCRGVGGPLFVSGTDLDGDAWPNPVSMGADEFVASSRVGPLSVSIETATNNVLPNRSLPLVGRIAGLASRIDWSFGDGPMVTNVSYVTSHAWMNPGDYTVTFTAYNDSSPAGVSASAVIHVLPLESPTWAAIEKIIYSDTYQYYQFSFNTQVGVTNTIEYATNLVAPINWMTLTTSVATNVVMREYDLTPTNDARFYRLRGQ